MTGANRHPPRLTVETVAADQVANVIDAVSRLRVTVFREWPYLYEGDAAYERDYLAEFTAANDSVVVIARNADGEIVGAATASPLASHTSEFVPLFEGHGFKPDRVFYFGESVLLAPYRGCGVGHAFFDHRERAAKASRYDSGSDYALTAFCGVIRDPGDPRKPADYRALDPFWQRRGYRKIDGMIGRYPWREIGHDTETNKPMQFWVREL